MAKSPPDFTKLVFGPDLMSSGSLLTRQPVIEFSSDFSVSTDRSNRKNTVSLNYSSPSIATLSTTSNNIAGQVLGVPNTYVPVQQWLTASLSINGATAVPTGSITIQQAGYYLTACAMSFSGSAGTYTFNLFQNGAQHVNAVLQTTVASGQPFPVAVTVTDINYYNAGDVLDMRVKCNNAGANFQLGNGNFSVVRQA